MVKKLDILCFLTIAIVCYGAMFTMAQQKNVMQAQKKMVIYQLLPRYFGNKQTTNIPYGTIAQNGCGKFNDITAKSLDGLKELHVNYIWYTGVLAHASLTDYTSYDIKRDDADVVKGRAGSPYAIRDYYDVDPDLAVNVTDRLKEFEALIKRTHAKGIKVIIDFVPNHVARGYHSNAKPVDVVDFGANDNRSVAFHPKNDFYYIPGQSFHVPLNPKEANSPLKSMMDGKFDEYPAKATGNNVFSASPNPTDWYETVKLNYGVEYKDGKEINHFSPIPPVWTKMHDILIYWAGKGVDGFRCDVAEMVPVEFWEWVIPQVKATHPGIIFIAEAYNPKFYEKYLTQGKFDFLYDKVGLYDALKKLIKNEPKGDVNDINHIWQVESANFGDKMIRFLENHDEERIASKAFAGKAELAKPAMVVSAMLGGGPVLLYFGQEVGEEAGVSEGFIGDDDQLARTTIFEYWGVPNHQKWMNNGRFDGKLLNTQQRQLRLFYQKLMQIATQNEVVVKGAIAAIEPTGNMNNKMYAFVRYTKKQRFLIVANFDRKNTLKAEIKIDRNIITTLPANVIDLLSGKSISIKAGLIPINLAPTTAQIIQF